MAVTIYAEQDTLKQSLGINDTNDDLLLGKALSGSSRAIDRVTGRRFWLDEAPVARIYRPGRRVTWDRDGMLLMTDDIGDAAGLTVETGTAGSWTPINDYETHPENALATGEPITGLLRLAWWFGGFGLRVRITARWGWPAVPNDVEQACLILARRLFHRKDSPAGIMGSQDWVVNLARKDPDVQALLDPVSLPGIG
ncbi:phage gp6-like head-tail connector protein [Actinocrispum wychmicini]|uniref:Phage gp6-like head-tail connector protein n=1 Tax=Actinocrispum wychmicini TaxID=1213861 RepID=A0A4R2K558_9PSEU|nr:phage gp6-like head-tail connector protein [Actinocrispum wychmicini]TCO64949.1 hypothetical protein EV192_101733 [Actinocrispum wychmicini]